MRKILENLRVGIFVSAFFCLFFGCGELTVKTFAAPGDLDPTFGGGDGLVISEIGSEDRANAMVVQPDGKIVLGGRSRGMNSSWPVFALARYNPDGSLDETFGAGGKVVTFLPGGSLQQEINALALQPDGKIVAVGSMRNSGNALIGAGIARYNPDGSFDTTFDGDGVVIYDRGVDRAVVLQTDGRIVVAGGGGSAALADFQIARFNSNGSLDTTFDGDGHVTLDFNGSGDGAWALALQPDGKIVAVGRSRTSPSDGTSDNFALARLLPNGSLDATFSGDGKVTTDFANQSDIGYAVELQPDGRIVVAGQAVPGVNDWDFGVARYNPDGSLDTSFGGGGKTLIPFDVVDIAFAVKLQRNGKIVVGGKTPGPAALARLNSNGTLDPTFGAGGKVFAYFNATDEIRALAIQRDGKILAAGTADGGAIIGKFALARYLGDPAANQNSLYDFDGDGRADVSVYRDGVWHLLQSTAGYTSIQFGIAGDKLVPADYDRDGKTDPAVFRSGTWYVLSSATNQVSVLQFGLAEDVPQTGDYDGDGRADLSVFRPSNRTWYVQQTQNGFAAVQFGLSDDKPVAADYDGDGRTDIAVYRATGGVWHLLRSRDGYTSVQFGIQTDRPAPADYDADGKTDPAVYRDGTWYVSRSRDGNLAFQFGLAGDKPAPADFDGDGKADPAVYRAGVWHLQGSASGYAAQQFGLAGDVPVPFSRLP